MAGWKNNDREQGKPNWLTEAQKRQCVRTDRGWEIPIPGGTPITTTGASHVDYELLVALSNDGSVARSSDPTTNSAPYFATPLTGDSVTAGGYLGDNGGYTALGLTQGITGYIPIVLGDADSTDVYKAIVITGPWVNNVLTATAGSTFGLLTPGGYVSVGNGYPRAGWLLGYTGGNQNAGGMTQSPVHVVNSYLSGITDGGAILQVFPSAATGDYTVMVRAYDDAGLTAEVTFKVYVGYTGF